MKPFVLGIGGGSGAGKSSLAAGLERTFPGMVQIMHLDDYYRPEADVPVRAHLPNWDSPQALYYGQMARDLANLKATATDKPLIIFEGFLSLHYPKIRQLLDVSVYLDIPFYTHIERRVRPLTPAYRQLVLRPMHDRYVVPSKVHATKTINVSTLSRQQVLDQVAQMVMPYLT